MGLIRGNLTMGPNTEKEFINSTTESLTRANTSTTSEKDVAGSSTQAIGSPMKDNSQMDYLTVKV